MEEQKELVNKHKDAWRKNLSEIHELYTVTTEGLVKEDEVPSFADFATLMYLDRIYSAQLTILQRMEKRGK